MSSPIVERNASGVLQPTLRGNDQLPPRGCYPKQSGGYHHVMKNTESGPTFCKHFMKLSQIHYV